MAQLNERQKDFLRWWVGEEAAGRMTTADSFVVGQHTTGGGVSLTAGRRKGGGRLPVISEQEMDGLAALGLLTAAGRRTVANNFGEVA